MRSATKVAHGGDALASWPTATRLVRRLAAGGSADAATLVLAAGRDRPDVVISVPHGPAGPSRRALVEAAMLASALGPDRVLAALPVARVHCPSRRVGGVLLLNAHLVADGLVQSARVHAWRQLGPCRLWRSGQPRWHLTSPLLEQLAAAVLAESQRLDPDAMALLVARTVAAGHGLVLSRQTIVALNTRGERPGG